MKKLSYLTALVVILALTALRCDQGAPTTPSKDKVVLQLNALAFLDGKALRVQVRFPDLSTTESSVDVTVGPGVEITSIGGSQLSIDFSDTQIRFEGGKFFVAALADFNGVQISDISGTIPDFGSVTVNFTSGLDPSPVVTFGANNIFVNFSGVTIQPDAVHVLDVAPLQLNVGNPNGGCCPKGFVLESAIGNPADRNGDNRVCQKVKPHGGTITIDNNVPPGPSAGGCTLVDD